MNGLLRRGALFALALMALHGCSLWRPSMRASHPLEGVTPPSRTPAPPCRALARSAVTQVERAPYLQDARPDHAHVVWTSRARGVQGLIYYPVDSFEERRASVRPERQGEDIRWVATLTGLRPSVRYCYEIVSADGGTVYGPVAFKSPPALDDDGPVRLLVFGDSGGAESAQRQLRDRMMEVPHDLILHGGDLAYFDATRAHLDEQFFDMYERLLRSVPVYPVLGEHDRRVRDGAPWRAAFRLPNRGEERGFYSFDWGPVHVAAIDTLGDLAAQARWLDEDLAAVSGSRWRVVLGHRPAYSAGMHGGDDAVRRHIVPVLERRDVDLYLSGHDHDYERTRAVRGVTYVVSGGGGYSTRPVGSTDLTERSESVVHFVLLDVRADRIRLLAIDAHGAVFDEHWLRR